MNERIRSGLIRAARTFLQTFLAVLMGAPLLEADISSVKAAAIAGIGAVLSLAQRMLDDTPVGVIPPG